MAGKIKSNLPLIIGLLLVAFLFYWFQIRPANIIKKCSMYDDRETEYHKINLYKDCLHENGLK